MLTIIKRLNSEPIITSMQSTVCLKQVYRLLQSEFSTECALVLPLSVSGILSFPYCHPVTAYAFFLVLPSMLSFYPSFNNVY